MKAEILSEVKESLSHGLSHQEIFDQLKEKYHKDGKLLTETLCKLPIPSRKKKLQFLWIILLVVLSLLAALRSLSLIILNNGIGQFVNLVILAILLYIIYSVIRYEKYTFQFLGVLGLVNMYWILHPVMVFGSMLTLDGLISLFMIVAMCICSYILYYKLFVKHSVTKVPVQYMDGTSRFEIQAKFTER